MAATTALLAMEGAFRSTATLVARMARSYGFGAAPALFAEGACPALP